MKSPTKTCKSCDKVRPEEDFWLSGISRKSACKDCTSEAKRLRYANDPMYSEKHKAAQRGDRRFLTRQYGITPEEYDQMWMQQGGTCDICDLPETRKARGGGVTALAVDHNHETLEVRALLCHACNVVIGLANEDPATLQRAIEYLERHSD